MIEVEAKIKISDPVPFRRIASQLGKFSGKEKKIDEYYTLEDLSKYPKKSLRVRRRKGVYEVNFKQRLSYIRGIHAKNEEEFKLRDITPFLDLIHDFGFKQWLRKTYISACFNLRSTK